jgi:hypothetical protein
MKDCDGERTVSHRQLDVRVMLWSPVLMKHHEQ